MQSKERNILISAAALETVLSEDRFACSHKSVLVGEIGPAPEEKLSPETQFCGQIVAALPRLDCGMAFCPIPDGLVILQKNTPPQRNVPRPPDRTRVYPYWDLASQGIVIAYGDKYQHVTQISRQNLASPSLNPRHFANIGGLTIPICRPIRAQNSFLDENLRLQTVKGSSTTNGIVPWQPLTESEQHMVPTHGLQQVARIMREEMVNFIGADSASTTTWAGLEDLETGHMFPDPLCYANLVWLAQAVTATSGTEIEIPSSFREIADRSVVAAQTRCIVNHQPGTDKPDKTNVKEYEVWLHYTESYLNMLEHTVRAPEDLVASLYSTYNQLLYGDQEVSA